MGAGFSRKLPHQDFRLYFAERLLWGWDEMLCCPEVAGCSIRKYSEDDPTGGHVEYTVMRSVSYSPYVPRFVMEVISRNIPRPAVVGRLEKLDTIFRAKTGEFLCVHLWKLVVNGLQWANGRHRSVLASEEDMSVHHVGIVTQAKIDFDHPSPIEWVLKPESERWMQSVSTDWPMIQLQTKAETTPRAQDLKDLRFKYDGHLVAAMKQQNFIDSDEDFRSYLGVQLDNQKLEEKLEKLEEKEDVVHHRLTTEALTIVLMGLAWSQSTLMAAGEGRRHWKNFVNAMRSHPDEPESGQMKGYPSEWNRMDVKKYLGQHSWWLRFHSWDSELGEDANSPATTIPASPH